MSLLAHQGGWDEALFVAIPLLGIVGLLWLARRRADRNLATGQPTPGAPGSDTADP